MAWFRVRYFDGLVEVGYGYAEGFAEARRLAERSRRLGVAARVETYSGGLVDNGRAAEGVVDPGAESVHQD